MRRRGAIAAALALAGALGAALAAPAPELPFALTVTSRSGTSALEREIAEKDLLLRLAKADCGLRPARENETPAIDVRVELVRWREADVPGGEPVFDPTTGRYLPGRRREVEVRYTLSVARHGEAPGKDDGRQERQVRAAAETHSNPLYEPRVQANLTARELLAKEVAKRVCRFVKRQKRR